MNANRTGEMANANRTGEKSDKGSIENLSSAIFDNGRRGNPKPGCDCVQCFGYCMVDQDAALRAGFDRPATDAGILDVVA